MPQTYTSIECGAFEGLTGLEMLTVPFVGGSRTANRFLAYTFGAETYEDNTYSFAGYSDGSSLYMGDQHMEDQLLPLTLKTVRVTESVSDFAEGAFYAPMRWKTSCCRIRKTCAAWGTYAFAHCLSFGYDSALGLAISPAWLRYVTSIGDSAFESYTGNTSSTVQYVYPYGEEYPDYRAELITYEYPFNNLSSIPKLENIETIGSRAFYYAAGAHERRVRRIAAFGGQLCVYLRALHRRTAFPRHVCRRSEISVSMRRARCRSNSARGSVRSGRAPLISAPIFPK